MGENPFVDNADQANLVAEMLKALAHPLRLRVIAALCEASHTVTQLVERLDTRQTLVSQHLSVLRMTGLVEVERTGGMATYSIKEPQLRNLVACLTGCKRGS